MYRQEPTYELRCPRGHVHKDPGAEGAYCRISPCQGIVDWYSDLKNNQQIRKHFLPPTPEKP